MGAHASINFPGGRGVHGGQFGAVAVVGPTPPANPATGALWYDTTTALLMVWNGAAWVPSAVGGGGGGATVTVGTTTTLGPGTPASVNNSGTTTNAIFNFGIPQGIQGPQGQQGAQGPAGTGASVGPFPPVGPTQGALWFNTTNGVLSVWNGTVWEATNAGAASQGTVAWNFNQGYVDPAGYVGRVLPAGYNAGLTIATGAYPPGYRVDDGSTIGGVFATGTSNGTLPIRIQPVQSGVGILKFHAVVLATIVNQSTTATATFEFGVGVTASNGPNKPTYPYLGVSHVRPPLEAMRLGPQQAVQVSCFELLIMDNAFQSDQPIPGWPNWQMLTGSQMGVAGGSRLYPALVPTMTTTGASLLVRDILMHGFAC